MIQTGFESKIKVQQIIDSQLPEFILDESPKISDFLKQYYISQEYQGGPIDITENLDQYLKLDNLTPESIIGSTNLTDNVTISDTTIYVSSTKGFPNKYGLLKIDDEIITYTGLTTNTFTGCVRGFSGVTSYSKELNSQELVFSTSESKSHKNSSKVENLSSLFLKEFYKKLKYSLIPDLQNTNFVSNLNVRNFIKEARTLYETKGTEESFRILFNILFGETPKIIDLEKFLIKSSSASYIRRASLIVDLISGDPFKLVGQTIYKNTDINTTASVSEVETISRKGKIYYKLLLFIGYNDAFPTIVGNFEITGSTKNLDYVSVGSSVISVDSTIGFPESGTIYSGDNVIPYSSKSVNQFFGCEGIQSGIATASIIRSDETYYGYEDGDTSKKVEFRITGVLSGYQPTVENSSISVGDKIYVKNLGESIKNPEVKKTYKHIFANSWIYNTSSRFQVDSFNSGDITSLVLKLDIDKSSLKVGDHIDILVSGSQEIVAEDLEIVQIDNREVSTLESFTLVDGINYDIRRKINYANSLLVPLEFDKIISDVQNVYNENDEYAYVASNSLPSYDIDINIFSYNALTVDDQDLNTGLYSTIRFENEVSFITGTEIYYKPSLLPISGLFEGIYYVEVLPGNTKIRLYTSRLAIEQKNFVSFGTITEGIHNFTINSQIENILSPQKILRKFPLSKSYNDKPELTNPGKIGLLVNGVEIVNYKNNNKVYYGPLESVDVLNGGKDYDVVNPPILSISSGNASIQPIISGSVKKVYVKPQDFDIDVIVSASISGGNGSGAFFEPVIERKRREIEFDARQINEGGGVDVEYETITFLTSHNLIDGQQVIYRSGNNPSLGIGSFLGSNNNTGNTLKEESNYYVKIISDTTIQLYPSFSDYNSGINTVGFTTIGTSGVQKFVTEPKNKLIDIKVINGGSGYTNRKLRVSPSGISTTNNTISFKNHGFNDGELVTYSYSESSISGLTTSNQYYVIKINDDVLRLSDAGIGGTIKSNYDRKKYVDLQSTGTGYQIFSYPDILLNVEYTIAGLNTSQVRGKISATPIVRGEITGTYVYDNGSDYGSKILDYHKKPSISVKNGKDALLKPIIVSGRIEKVIVEYGGIEYYSEPDIIVLGDGVGAVLRPVIVNNKISEVDIINKGFGYSGDKTTLIVKKSGENVIFDPKVRSLTINNNLLYKNNDEETSDLLSSSLKNLQYCVCSYSENLQNKLGDNDANIHSPIIGWAYDGNPIYGSYGYSDPKNKNSPIKRLVSGYELRPNDIVNRPAEFLDGFFIEDYKFTNCGDLDQYNGRFCITPEFPNGVYAYFATSIINDKNSIIGSFPYFIGNKYKSKFITDNQFLDQSFNFNNSNLIRNTFPYNVGEQYADNDFLIESNEIINQVVVVESVISEDIDEFDIINSGINYKVNDPIIFDETETKGSGLLSKVSEVKGKDILNLQTSVDSYSNAVFVWDSKNKIKVKIKPSHALKNLDYVNISGFSTDLSKFNGIAQIGVSSYRSTILKDIPAYSPSGIVTDIYVSDIPKSVSIGSTVKIEDETLSILNIFKDQNVIRVLRENTGSAHTETSQIYFIPDSFTFSSNTDVEYFDSNINDFVFFNPNQSIGVGTISGIGVGITNNVGIQTNNIVSIPTQSIYLPNHPFRTNQPVLLSKPSSGLALTVSNSSGGELFNIPSSGNSEKVYIIKKSQDYIGIVTQIGLTTSSNGLYFTSNGSDDYQYSIESIFNQIKGKVEKVITTVTTTTEHDLENGDSINLLVSSNETIGIGSSSYVKVLRDNETGYILINPINFSSSSIDTNTSSINLLSHGLKTGDKVKYTANLVASGLTTGFYFVYKIDDNNIKLSETYVDVIKTTQPNTVLITSSGGSTQSLTLVNPSLTSIKNNNLLFDLSDSSLFGYDFKVFYDKDFENEFISTGFGTSFGVIKSGTIGLSTDAKLSIEYDKKIPNNLFYSLEKSGYISTPDTDVIGYSSINFVDSYYNGYYKISGIGSTTFDIVLLNKPEKNSYNQSECDTLKYTTNSVFASGEIEKIKTISSGKNYDKLPIFKEVQSSSGTGAYILPKTKNFGKINQIRVINEGFEYSSDKTLRPEASVLKFVTLKNANKIKSIEVLEGGNNYITAPNLVILNSENNTRIDSGLLIANVSSNKIESVSIEISPVGIPESIVKIKAINNTNGVKIKSLVSSSLGIVTCTLVTPLFGFSSEPFSVGDKIYVEGIQKDGDDGDGFNSEDYGYEFFNVSSYTPSSLGSDAKLEFNISGLTTNPGVVKSIDNFYASIIKYDDYPKFKVTQDFSDFSIGEFLDVKVNDTFIKTDLKISESNRNYVKITGSYPLEENQTIRGVKSGSLSIVNQIKESIGKFIIDYSSIKKNGWSNNIGILDDDMQVIQDSDYYQNLSYSVKSSKEWNSIVSPVNSILHPSGLKNFADTEILNTKQINNTNTEDYTISYYDIIDENRVDTIYNFDLVQDVDTFGNSSNFVKFANKKLTDYIECNTNRVLEIDDISSEFSTADNIPPNDSSKIVEISGSSTRKYNRYLVQISSKDYSEFQFNELIVLNDQYDIFTLEKGSISNALSPDVGYESNPIADIYGDSDEYGNYYLKFDTKDETKTYNIKYLNTTFTNTSPGIGTYSIGFVNLTGVTTTVSSGSTVSLITANISEIKSVHSGIHILDESSNEMNYVEIFLDHDGTDTNISEFYFDGDNNLSYNVLGEFNSSISSNILKLEYTNNSDNDITIRTRNVGFGSTSLGIGTHRFKQAAQIEDTENTVKYDSLYTNVSSASTIKSFDSSLFSSLKSTIKVSIGQTSALHQVMLITDGVNAHTTQYPFLSIGSTSGIGTFGSEISGEIVSLKFYPDFLTSENFEILSFNESFYRENDYINSSPNLQYSNILETVGVSKYISKYDLDNINKLDFEIKYQDIPIFMKKFDPSDSSVLNLSTGEFNIENHFFSTGEQLIYRPNSTFEGVNPISVGIGSTLNHVGLVTDILPQTVYAIKVTNDTFKIATREEYAIAGIGVTFTSIGSGNAHEFEMIKKNEKCIISINNVIQSPIAYSLLNFNLENNNGGIGSDTSIFALSGITSIGVNDIVKINNEYMKVINVGFGSSYTGPISFAGTFPLIEVDRGFVGSSSTSHTDSSAIFVYRGSFNIEKSKLYFTEPPRGNIADSLFEDFDELEEERDYFNGRVFLRKNYSSNVVYDNISENFTGIDQSYNLTVGGANTIGLGESGGNGIVLINGIYQTPTTQNNINNNFSITEDTISGISTIVFSGITSTNGSIVISENDVNNNQLPRGGIIVSLGSTPGLGYAPLVGASVTAIVSGGVITTIGIGTTGNWGSGYNNPVSIAVTDSNHTGSPANITANVGAGGTLSFTIIDGGSGYVDPTINISNPSYSNLPITGVSRLGIGQTTDCGVGLLLNIDVGASSTTGIGSTLFEVTGFKIVRNGYGFRPGDVIKPIGLVTAYGLSQPISEFELTILDTFTDSFSSWQFGEVDYIDSIKKYQDGIRTRFPLFYNAQLISFEKNLNDPDSELIDFNSLLLIFINGILQQPKVSYEFNGGSLFTFKEPPKVDDNVSIYFYRGSSEDSSLVNANENIKPGDIIQIHNNNNILDVTETQDPRVVSDILSADKIETNTYILQGIDETNFKPLSWTKQKVDKIINGQLISKARDSIETQIYPTAKIIGNLNISETEIFVDDSQFFNYEEEVLIDTDAIIVSDNFNLVSAAVTAVVSSAGTIQSLSINNFGGGYTGSSLTVSISSPPEVGLGIGTTASASISIENGSLSVVTITNPGFGYNPESPPQVLVPPPSATYEQITGITEVQGYSGNITGIETAVGIGTDLALTFTLSSVSNLLVGYPIYIFDTTVGTGVTSILNTNSEVIGIGTTCLDNIYYISAVSSSGIVTCNIHSESSVVGIATTGYTVGKFSWGKLSGFNRSSNPVSIAVSGFTINSGLSSFPTIQRRGYGLRDTGSLKKEL